MMSFSKNNLQSFISFQKRYNLGKSITISSLTSIIIVFLLFISEYIYAQFNPITGTLYLSLLFLNSLRFYHNKNFQLDNQSWINRFSVLQVLIIFFFCAAICINFHLNKSTDLKVILYIFLNSIASALSLWLFLEIKTLLVCCALLMSTAAYGFYDSNHNLFLTLFSVLAVGTYFGNLIRQSYIKYSLWLQERSDEFKLRQLESLYKQKKFSDLGQLVSEIMHDLNNPLSNIYMKVQILEKQLLKYSDASHIIETIDSLKKSSLRISKIANAINELAGKAQSNENQSISIADLFNSLIEKMQIQCDINFIEMRQKMSTSAQQMMATVDIIYSFDLILSLLDFSIAQIKNDSIKWINISLDVSHHFILLKIGDSENESLKKNEKRNWTSMKIKRSEAIHKFIEKNLVENGGSFAYHEQDLNYQYTINISLNHHTN
jgi:signal transduction histidine kinase